MPRRKSGDDADDAWADRHEGDCAMGQIHELREANPVGRPFERQRGPLGFLEWDGDALTPPKQPQRRSRRRS